MNTKLAASTERQRHSSMADRYWEVRAETEALCAGLSPEDQVVQSMPDASPTKWHRAHSTWFFETFVLVPHFPGYRPFDPAFGFLFNSYYEAVGARHPRAERGLLTRPDARAVGAYRAHVDAAMTTMLERGVEREVAALVELGLQHEQQHQELLLMDILHAFAQNPLRPAYATHRRHAHHVAPPLSFMDLPGGTIEIGHVGDGFAFDNEGPRHRVLVPPYALANRLVTNAEWLSFMADDGYRRPELWLADGWAVARREGWDAPLYWEQAADGSWQAMGLTGLRPIELSAPVVHVSYYEADAYARWAGHRLPTEAEWEAAFAIPASGPVNDLGSGLLRPVAPTGDGDGLLQMMGDAWEWTQSPYTAYPGFRPPPGAVGEYNGKFMVNQMVLRGGACVTPAGHARPTYRNFFYPHQRWQFGGVRLASDRNPGSQVVATVPPNRAMERFRKDVVNGLSAPRKVLLPKYFYDAEGARLFEAICELTEYYVPRVETGLLQLVTADIDALVAERSALVEFGSGASAKTRILLDATAMFATYVPIDISAEQLGAVAATLRRDYPALDVRPVAGDFTRAVDLPLAGDMPRFGFFPGSTIGNLERAEGVAFLRAARATLGPGSHFLVGVDLVKDVGVLRQAYDDPQGVTAAFNLNLLERINRELDATFDPRMFAHRVVWDAERQRIEMHLESLAAQTVRVGDRTFDFAPGETIHTENSHKFTVEAFGAMAVAAGWTVKRSWIDWDTPFAVVLLQA